MNPFYFGSSRKRLYGVYHPPAAERASMGVVLCGALREEYLFSHRAMRTLASNLSEQGFPTLRFDYYATGDSDGETLEGTTAQWLEDIEMAIDELMAMSGVSSVCLIGMRMGAVLAAKVASKSRAVSKIVLWEPVIKGEHYVEELTQEHQHLVDEILPKMEVPHNHGINDSGLFGFPVTDQLVEEYQSLSLEEKLNLKKKSVLCLSSELSENTADLMQFGDRSCRDFEFAKVVDQRVWKERALGSNELVPARTLQMISSWLEERA